jgi:hypothetical protein
MAEVMLSSCVLAVISYVGVVRRAERFALAT